ncbi:MAG: hypothetical protein J5497_04085 [Selenomonadaceae bacterium]|nr:hypothetical protein [Selenomonadaceae bacterium]
MTRVCTVPSKESVPPVLWGVIEWETPDGMNAKRVQVLMQAFIMKTHRLDVMCRILGVPKFTAELYLKDERTIPKGVVYRLPRLKEIIMQNPARTLEILDRFGASDLGSGVKWHDSAVAEVRIQANSEINADAQGRVGWRFQSEREKRHWSIKQLVEKLAEQGVQTYDSNLCKVEKLGITPKNLLFFPLCELYGVRPEIFGFVASYGERVKKWRKAKNARENTRESV